MSPILISSLQDRKLYPEPEAPTFHTEVIAEAFPAPENLQESDQLQLTQTLEPKLPSPSKGQTHRIDVTPSPQNEPHPMHSQSSTQHNEIFPSFHEFPKKIPSSLKEFSQPYLNIIQHHYVESDYLAEKYGTSDHYLFSLFSQSHQHLTARLARHLKKNHEVQLELASALWAVENHLMMGPLERAFEGGWLIDHQGLLWDVLTPSLCEDSLNQENTPHTFTSIQIKPILKRLKTFLALNHPTLQRNISARVLMNLGLLRPELKREFSRALEVQLDAKEFQWISFIDFNPELVLIPPSSRH